MNDFRAEPPELQAAMLDAASRVFESGWYVLGPEVEAFEKRWAEACGVRFATGVGNGMDAIEISLRALDIGPGDEVITTPMTAFATTLAILRAGATPVLADIDPNTGLMSLESAARCISPDTRAILPVHLYGQLRDMDAWQELCRKHGLALVEDCAQAHLASWNGQVAGSFGEAGAYSFYPTKNLGAPGDAGMLVTNSESLSERAKQLRNYGQSDRYHHPEIGLNSRLDELQAAILSARMDWLQEFTERRRQIAAAYLEGIEHSQVNHLEKPQETSAHVYHLFVVTCAQRESLAAHLGEQGVQTLVHYPVPVHKQKPCRDIARDPQGLSACEQFADSCLSLPCHPQLTDEDVTTVIESVNAFRSD